MVGDGYAGLRFSEKRSPRLLRSILREEIRLKRGVRSYFLSYTCLLVVGPFWPCLTLVTVRVLPSSDKA